MTRLQMKRAARAAGAQTRAIAIYAPNSQPDPAALASLVLTAAFSASLWAIFLMRAVILFS